MATLTEYGEATAPVRSEIVRPGSADAVPSTSPHRPATPEPAAPVKIQEADAKSLLVAQGLPVPDWEVAHTVAEARAAAERFLAGGAGAVVIKAQVLVGGRGKAGGVKLAAIADEAEPRRGGDPRHGHQGHHRPQGARRAGGRHRHASSTCRRSSTGPRGGSC